MKYTDSSREDDQRKQQREQEDKQQLADKQKEKQANKTQAPVPAATGPTGDQSVKDETGERVQSSQARPKDQPAANVLGTAGEPGRGPRRAVGQPNTPGDTNP